MSYCYYFLEWNIKPVPEDPKDKGKLVSNKYSSRVVKKPVHFSE